MVTRLDPNSPFFHEERHIPLGAASSTAITVCGAGALGGNLAETLARMGYARLRVIDRDRVETRNLSTQPYGRGEVGAPKARALANTLYRAVGARVEPVAEELTEENASKLLAGAALVVDALDNRDARAAVSAEAARLRLPCLHVGFALGGMYGSGIWEPGYQVPQDVMGDPCDYPLTRPLAVVLAGLAAAAVTRYLLDESREDFELTWSDLRVSTWSRDGLEEQASSKAGHRCC